MIFPALFLAVFVTGVVLFFVGLRGKQVNDHPYCAACGFDLTGRYPNVERCPECGTSVQGGKRVRFGRMEKRRQPLTIGGALVLLGGGLLITVIWLTLQGTSVQKYLPTWMLRAQLAWVDNVTAATALNELDARLRAGTLTQGDIDAVVKRGLARQGDLNQAWLVEWGDFIESAQAKGKLSQADLKTYARQFVRLDFIFREIVREGDEWTYGWRTAEVWGGSGTGYNLHITPRKIIYGEQQWVSPDPGGYIGMGISPSSTGSKMTTHRSLGFSASGEDTLDVVIEYDLNLTPLTAPSPTAWTETHHTTARIVPREEQTVTLRVDPSLTLIMHNAMAIHNCEISGGPSTSNQDLLTLSVEFKNPPLGVAFDVLARMDGREVVLGSIAAPAGTTHSWHTVRQVLDAPFSRLPDDFAIILRASDEAARNTIDLYEIWDGELIYDEVPVLDKRNG